MSTTSQQNMSTPPRESTLDVNANTTPLDVAQATLSSPGQASSSVVENPSEPSAPTIVQGAMQTAPRRASSSSYHISLISKPVPEIPQQHIEVIEPAELPPRVASPMFLPPTSVSTHGGHGNRSARPRADTLPRRSVRVGPSYPIVDETIHAPRPVVVPPGGFYPSRRSIGRYPDSETAWHVRDDPEPVRLIACCPRSNAVPELTSSVWVPSVPPKKRWPALDSDHQCCNRRVC